MAAVVVYTTHDKFEDKGNPHDDILVISVRPKPYICLNLFGLTNSVRPGSLPLQC